MIIRLTFLIVLFMPNLNHALAQELFFKPTGPYSVGYRIFELTDQKRQDPYTLALTRKISVTAYYPSNGDKTLSNYNEAAIQAWQWRTQQAINATKFISAAHINWFLTNLTKIQVYQTANAEPAPKQFPVILFEPGCGCMSYDYLGIILELVSHGYVIIGIDHPYIANRVVWQDGTAALFKITNIQADLKPAFVTAYQDLLAVLEQLTTINLVLAQQLDLTKIGIIGHSLGGGIAIKAAGLIPAIKAGVNLDGSSNHLTYERTSDYKIELAQAKLTKPFLDIFAKSAKYQRDYSKLFLSQDQFKITMAGIEHMAFTDSSILNQLLNLEANTIAHDYLEVGTRPACEYLPPLNNLLQLFFDKYLQQQSDIDLMALSNNSITIANSHLFAQHDQLP